MPTPAPSIRQSLVEMMPALRAFARSLTRERASADDLVQDTLVKALTHIDKFEVGTNLRAWLFTIMRHEFYDSRRKHARERDHRAALPELPLGARPDQEWVTTAHTVQAAVERLPPDQQQALVLTTVLGVSYEEATQICGCPIGTIRSRVSRARERLMDEVKAHNTSDLISDDRVFFSAIR